MKINVQSKLKKLKAGYSQIKGQPFTYFYCPVLFKDENVELCQAHIINLAFPNSSREWTIQRKDVDNFYGSNFEADFVDIHYGQEGYSDYALIDKKLTKRLKPKILVDNQPVDHFFSTGDVPDNFTPVTFENNGETIQIGLKISPEDFLAKADKVWEIEVSKDLRVSSMVSLIKAAHLTLFEILGYRYALSAGGHFVGRDILGSFFIQHRDNPKTEVLKAALPYFREFAHMVRPIHSMAIDLKGTIVDHLLHICIGHNNVPWAMIVYVVASGEFHAVMIPIFDQPYAVERFLNFLKSDEDSSIEVLLGRFVQDHWEVGKDLVRLDWPKTGVLYPELEEG